MKLGLRLLSDGRFFPVTNNRSLIGSSPCCPILLEGDGVAAEHARIRFSEVGVYLEDLSTPGGSSVNGYRATAHFLARGDEVRLGSVVCRFELEPEDVEPNTFCERCGAELDEPKAAAPEPPRRCGHCQGITAKGPAVAIPVSARPAPPTQRRTAPPILEAYEVLALIGEGAQARVYRLRDRRTEQIVAGKHLTSTGAKAARRLKREADALRRLDHPSIVKLHEVVADGLELLLVMEFVDGESVEKMIKSRRRVVAAQLLAIGAQMADALAYASSQGMVHRDLKPSNILVGRGNRSKLTDFGLVRFQDSGTKLTLEGAWVGTLPYMSPEQFDGPNVDAASDVWSLGVTLYEALTGTLPFVAATPSALYRLIKKEPPDLTRVQQASSEGATDLLARMLAKDPKARPTPAQARDELARLSSS